MRIDSVEMFYLSMPQVLDIGDGSQDMCLVRVRAGEWTGWGECEAAPLPTIAGLVMPMSHSACHPVRDCVVGERLEGPRDIARIAAVVRARCLDLLQADHVWSGIEIALWDLLGRRRSQPVYELLGFTASQPRTPYASQLFGDTPADTLLKAREVAEAGYRAAKFGWGPYGLGSVEADADQVMAAREGLGDDVALLVDAGTVWGEDVEAASLRLPALQAARVLLLEEPFLSSAFHAYAGLAARSGEVRLAGGEGAHDVFMGRNLIDFGGIGYVQIDTGRIGGIGPAHTVFAHARAKGVQFVNHTFTSHLALSASLQPYAGSTDDWLCEYPVEPQELARVLTTGAIERDGEGLVRAPEAPGLGLDIDIEAIRPFLRDVEIRVDGRTIYTTPQLEQ